MANGPFPPPNTPYTLKQIVDRIVKNKDYAYAAYIHAQVCQARKDIAAGNNNSSAVITVNAHFQPDPRELSPMNFSPTQQTQLAAACTDPKTHLIAFAGDVGP
jgi:hypothetical protein